MEIGQAVPCRAIQGNSISVSSTLPPSLLCRCVAVSLCRCVAVAVAVAVSLCRRGRRRLAVALALSLSLSLTLSSLSASLFAVYSFILVRRSATRRRATPCSSISRLVSESGGLEVSQHIKCGTPGIVTSARPHSGSGGHPDIPLSNTQQNNQ